MQLRRCLEVLNLSVCGKETHALLQLSGLLGGEWLLGWQQQCSEPSKGAVWKQSGQQDGHVAGASSLCGGGSNGSGNGQQQQ